MIQASTVRARRAMVGLVAAAVLPLAIAGCSGSGGGGTTTGPATSTTSTTSSPLPSGGSSVIGPVILTPDQASGEVQLGRTVVFNLGDDPAAWDLVTSDPSILALVPGGTRDGATFNWGAETLKVGKASVIATPKGSGTPVTFIVSVVAA